MSDPIEPQTTRSTQVEQIQNITGIDYNPTNIDIITLDRELTAGIGRGSTAGERNGNTGGNIPYIVDSPKLEDTPTTKKYEYQPLIIKYLPGSKYVGIELDLGSNIQEYSTSQSANWSEKKGQKMRQGLEFNSISARTLSFTVEFYHPYRDICPLVENLAHLQEIMEETSEPSRVAILIGKAEYSNAVCTSLSPKYSLPLPQAQGFRRATVGLEFKVGGGVGSPYQSAAPFANTAAQIFARSRTLAETKEASADFGRKKLIRCLNEEEDAQYEQMLQDLEDDPQKISELPDNLFLQVSIAGLPRSITSEPVYQKRLRKILGYQVGVATVGEANAELFSSLLAENQKIPSETEEQHAFARTFDDLYQAVLSGRANTATPVRSRGTLIAIGACGLSFAQNGGLSIVEAEKEIDASWGVANFNQLLADNSRGKISDIELRQMLKIPNSRQGDLILQQIKAAKVYSSKEEFVAQFRGLPRDEGAATFDPYASWGGVAQSDRAALETLNEFLATASDAKAIQKRLAGKKGGLFGGSPKLSENTAALLANQQFDSKEAFLKRVYELENPRKDYSKEEALSGGNVYWHSLIRPVKTTDF